MGTHDVVGDGVTWHKIWERRRTYVEDPPKWHPGAEEERSRVHLAWDSGVDFMSAEDNDNQTTPSLMNSAATPRSFPNFLGASGS